MTLKQEEKITGWHCCSWLFCFLFCTDILLVPNGSEELSQAFKSLRDDQQGKEKEKEKDDLQTGFFYKNIVPQKSLWN